MNKRGPSARQINNVVGIIKSTRQLQMRNAIEQGKALVINHETDEGKALISVCEDNNIPYIYAADVFVVEEEKKHEHENK